MVRLSKWSDIRKPWHGHYTVRCTLNPFHSNRFLDPIYFGDYPAVMRENVGNRLPHFSEDEILLLRGCLDFIGINHYTSRYTASGPTPLDPQQSHHFLDQCVIVSGSLSLTHLALVKYFTTKWHIRLHGLSWFHICIKFLFEWNLDFNKCVQDPSLMHIGQQFVNFYLMQT